MIRSVVVGFLKIEISVWLYVSYKIIHNYALEEQGIEKERLICQEYLT
jgi:hypothetical protein